jgi:hypothetical protein
MYKTRVGRPYKCVVYNFVSYNKSVFILAAVCYWFKRTVTKPVIATDIISIEI